MDLLIPIQQIVGEYLSDEDDFLKDSKMFDKGWWERRFFSEFGKKITLDPDRFRQEYKELKVKENMEEHLRNLSQDIEVPIENDIIEQFVLYSSLSDLLILPSKVLGNKNIDWESRESIFSNIHYYTGLHRQTDAILGLLENYQDLSFSVFRGIYDSKRYDILQSLRPIYSEEIRRVLNEIYFDRDLDLLEFEEFLNKYSL